MANILVVGPHPDDQELGMGGAIALLARQGHSVLLLDVTNGEPTPHGSVEVRAKEAAEAARVLSAPGNPVRRVLLGLKNRFVEHTIEARHAVAGVIRAHQASIVFAPYEEDAHPDHRAVTRIVEDARFDAKLTGVEMPVPTGMESVDDTDRSKQRSVARPIYPKWLFYYYATHLRIVREPSFCLDITGTLEQKMAAVRAYKSQFETNEKNRAVVEWVKASAVWMGSRIGTAAAEGFFTKEPVGLAGLGELVF